MHQTSPVRVLGRRRQINAERQAEIMRQHFNAARPTIVFPPPAKGECPTCAKVFVRLDKHRCKVK